MCVRKKNFHVSLLDTNLCHHLDGAEQYLSINDSVINILTLSLLLMVESSGNNRIKSPTIRFLFCTKICCNLWIPTFFNFFVREFCKTLFQSFLNKLAYNFMVFNMNVHFQTTVSFVFHCI